jgi:putative spermidine/putrescine transport system ATP-binding protein
VAGFVGTSNTIKGELALRLTGTDGLYALRPEKIHMDAQDAPLPSEAVSVDGIVEDVVYLGPHTRYLVRLNSGERLASVEQNAEVSSLADSAVQGQPVRLHWARESMLRLDR